MIGRRIESRGGLPWVPALSLVIALACGVGAVALGRPDPAVAAIFPLALALVAAWWRRQPPFTAEIAEDGIRVEEPPTLIPYATVKGVWADGWSEDPEQFRKRSCRLQVWHDDGILVVPERLDAPSTEVYRFLADRVTGSGGRDVDEVLIDYLNKQEADFGPEPIRTYRAAARPWSRSGGRAIRVVSVALLVAAVAWMALGFTRAVDEGWGWGGIVAAIFGILFFLASFAGRAHLGPRIPQRMRSSLVLGPRGMAMVQGHLQGEIAWHELIDIHYRGRTNSFTVSSSAAPTCSIRLKLPGADIDILDIYDRPLYVIHQQIRELSGRD